MLRAARRARRPLRDAADRVVAYLRGTRQPDGGFPDRSGRSDLYYTTFALQALAALETRLEPAAQETDEPAAEGTNEPAAGGTDEPAAGRTNEPAAEGTNEPAAGAAGHLLSSTDRYLRTFAEVATLDLVHTACLARCWAILSSHSLPAAAREGILKHLDEFLSADGGYHPTPGSAAGTAYGCFLALGALQDLDADPPDVDGLVRCLHSVRCPDGGYANERDLPFGSTPATAAAVVTLRELGQTIEPSAADWLLARQDAGGGFVAMPMAPGPDLLSTATALHALACAGVRPDDAARRQCTDFILGLLEASGGFRGHAADPQADCEYTFYGLLALGHLKRGP
jgi:prenyltransferase beta subunit